MIPVTNRKSKTEPSLVPVGLALLVMALSLTAIAISFASFGHLTGYASKIMELTAKKTKTTVWITTCAYCYRSQDSSSPSFTQEYA